MGIDKIDAPLLKRMFLAGAKRLDSKKDYINELNVFPVPDGDTGTNMTMTIMSAANEVEAIAEPTMANLSKAISQGALRGARGNSGVILSQLFRGFTRPVKNEEYIDAASASEAFRKASETAYKAVMKPKEGTILTVARGMSEKAQDILDTTEDLTEAFRQIIEYGNYMLSLTPEMLPVLKQAGVVDSGGKGLMTILEGAYDCMIGKEDPEEETVQEVEEELPSYTYSAAFLIRLSEEMSEDQEKAFAEDLAQIGSQAELTKAANMLKVSFETDEPGQAINKALAFGSLTNIEIKNLKEEDLDQMPAQEEEAPAPAPAPAEPEKEKGFVAVSVGDGIKEIFKGLGVDYVVEGGQTMNPSTADILDAVEKVNARTVFVMPNNKNIILAANQAAELCTDKKVVVIPSKTVPQGITAVINYSEGQSDEDNAAVMTEEMANVKSAQITFAVRNTTIDDKEVHEGDIMGLSDEGLAAVGTDVNETVLATLAAMADEDSEIITIYYGKDISEEEAQVLSDKVGQQYPDCEIELYNGGQPVYYYVLSVE